MIDYVRGLRLGDPKAVAVPERTRAPVEGLALLEGYECKECGYACVSEEHMSLHCRVKHRLAARVCWKRYGDVKQSWGLTKEEGLRLICPFIFFRNLCKFRKLDLMGQLKLT